MGVLCSSQFFTNRDLDLEFVMIKFTVFTSTNFIKSMEMRREDWNTRK